MSWFAGRRSTADSLNRDRSCRRWLMSRRSLWRLLDFQDLEPRHLLATINWSGAGDGTTWTSAANWVGGAVPGTNDAAVIGSLSQTINLSGSVNVGSVVSGAPLDIVSGSLTTHSGTSQANNGLTIASGASITANGAGTALTASGTIAINGASLFAQNGASISLAGLTTYNNSGNNVTFQASGTGSSLSLANLGSLVIASQAVNFNALAGGQVNLSGLTQTSLGTVNFKSDGTGSQLNIASLTSLSGTSNLDGLQATTGGTINDALLTTLSDASLTVDGTSTIATSQFTSIVNGAINIKGGTPALSAVTNINGSNINVTGGTLNLPGVTTFNNDAKTVTFQANNTGGTGSSLSLANLASMTVATSFGSVVNVQALAAGQINLSGLTQPGTGPVVFESDGSGSQLNISAITGLAASGNADGLQVTNGGQVNDALLTTLSNTTLTLDGTGTVAIGQLTSITNGAINNRGGAPSFNSLASIDGSNINITGGTLSLPLVTTYNNNAKGATFQVNNSGGTGSTLTLANLTSFTIANQVFSGLSIQALSNGTVNLPLLTQTGAGQLNFESDGAGSKLNLPALTSLAGNVSVGLQVTNSGTVVDPLLTTLDKTTLTLSSTGTIGISQFTRITNGGINIQSGSPSFTSLNDIDGSSINVTGGTLSLPLITAYNNINGNGVTLQANGSGANLTLANLTSVTIANQVFSGMNVQAVAGGTVNLPTLTQTGVGQLFFESDGAGSILNIAALVSMTGNVSDGLQVTNSGKVIATLLTTFDKSSLTVDGTGTVAVSQFTSITNGTINVRGGSLSFSGLTDIDNSTLNLSGGTPAFNNLAQIHNAAINLSSGTPSFALLTNIDGSNVNVSGSTLSLPLVTAYNNDGNGVTLQANGLGATLTLANLVSLTIPNQVFSGVTFQAASGGTVNLPALTQTGAGQLNFVSDGTGSLLNIPVLTGMAGNVSDGLQVTNGGKVTATSLTTLDKTTLTLDGTGTVGISQFTRITNGAINIRGGTPSFTTLNDIDGSSIDVSGGTLSLPLITAFNNDGNGVTLQANGSGATLTLANLSSLTIINQAFSGLNFQAISDGTFNLPSFAQINTTSPISFLSTGAGSVLNLPALTSIAATNGNTSFQVVNSGTVLDPLLATLSNVNLFLDGTGTISISQLTSLTASTLTITGGSSIFSNLANFNNSSVQVTAGATVSLPAITSYSNPNNGTYFQANGTNSLLSLANLNSLPGTSDPQTQFEALSGATINLSSLTQINNVPVYLESDGSGSVLNISSLTSVTEQSASSTLQGTTGGTIQDAALVSLSNVILVGDTTSTLALSSGQSYSVSAGNVRVQAGTWMVQGSISITSNPTLSVQSNFTLNGQGSLSSVSGSTVQVSGNLLGNTQNVNGFNPAGTVTFNNSSSNASSPQLVEAMSADVGQVSAGFLNNFDYGTFSVNNNAYVKLVDQSHNSTGTGSEAIYASSITVASGAMLDLNGLHIYAQQAQVFGTVLNGTIQTVATKLAVTTQPPATVAAGSGFGLTVAVEDSSNNVKTDFTGNVTLALANNPGGGTLGGALVVALTNGIATFSGLTLNIPGNGYKLAATSGTLTSATSSAFNVTPGAATQLLITTQPPSSVTAGSSFSLTVTAEDALGNLATAFTGNETVAIANNPGSGTLGGTLVVHANSGVAVFNGLTLNQVGSGYTLSVASGSLTSATSHAISVAPGAATKLVISSQPPTSVTANVGFGFTVTAEDAQGNVVPGFAGSESVVLGSNPGGSTLGGTLTATAIAGVAVFSGVTLNKSGNGYTLSARSSGLSSATTATFNITPGPATQLSITTQPPAHVTAGSSFNITVTAKDAQGNVATSFNGSETVALAANPNGGTLGGTLTASAANGVAVFSGLNLNIAGAGYTVSVSNSTLGFATSSAVSVSPGTATQLIITAQPPATVTAGSGFGFTVVAEDSSGNLATSFNATEMVSLAASPAGSTLGGQVRVLAAAGVAVFSGLSLTSKGSYNLAVASGLLTSATSGAISVASGTATQLVISSQPPTTVTAGSGFGLTVMAEDSDGGLATGFNGSETVALAGNPLGGNLAGTLTATAVNGIAIFSGLTLPKAGSGYTLSVSGSTLASTTSASISVTPGATTQLVVTTSTATVMAGNQFSVSVAAEDGNGNIDTSFTGGVTVALQANPGATTLGGTLTVNAIAGVASFNDLSLNVPAIGYTLQLTSGGLASVVTGAMTVPPVLIIGGSTNSNNDVSIMFLSPTNFAVNSGDANSAMYSTSDFNQVVYNAPTDGTFSKFVFDDPSGAITATQSLGSTTISSGGFQFKANGTTNLFLYGGAGSTATVDVSDGGSSSSNFFVVDTDNNYSYIANPSTGAYSELSGFGSETITGSAGTTYAYIYSTSGAKTVASPTQTTFTVGGVTSTLSNFPQVYVVGAKDGTDSVTLNSSSGTFVSTPSFSYVGGTSGGASFLLGAIYAAQVTAQASSSGKDTAVFYSYPNDTFAGTPGTSSLSGSSTNVAGSTVSFVTQALGFNSVSVFESGAGSDVANLTSPGNGSFFGTDSASTLTVGTSVITVNAYFLNSAQAVVAVPSQIVLTGKGDGTDSASIYDAPGNNALTASGSTATLTTALGTLSINKFGSVTANRLTGSNDTLHEQAIDFALKTVGNWTSV